MIKETVVTAKTTEEAVALAAKELGAEADAIEYTVIEEAKKGLFGLGSSPAKIKATYAPTAMDLALDFVNTLLKNVNIEATVTVSDDEDRKKINIVGDTAGTLIGHHGDTLDSLQHLVNLAACRTENKKAGCPKISVDVEGYRAKREDALRALARRMADKVIKYKKSVMLEPMNPYERRIIHSELQAFKGVSTNSIGSENNRKVVIYLDDQQ